jgi:hypothetical protein
MNKLNWDRQQTQVRHFALLYFILPLSILDQGTFGEAEETFRSQIKILEEEVSRYKVPNY